MVTISAHLSDLVSLILPNWLNLQFFCSTQSKIPYFYKSQLSVQLSNGSIVNTKLHIHRQTLNKYFFNLFDNVLSSKIPNKVCEDQLFGRLLYICFSYFSKQPLMNTSKPSLFLTLRHIFFLKPNSHAQTKLEQTVGSSWPLDIRIL